MHDVTDSGKDTMIVDEGQIRGDNRRGSIGVIQGWKEQTDLMAQVELPDTYVGDFVSRDVVVDLDDPHIRGCWLHTQWHSLRESQLEG